MSDSCCSSAPAKTGCGCGAEASETRSVNSQWTFKDYRGAVAVRLLNCFRNNYKVEPGLWELNNPDAGSPVFVSANYKLSFDVLRKSLKGAKGWILVLDTKGINVWCAAGKGTFGTKELAKQVLQTNLHEKVTHRTLIVPQLGAPGVKAHEVKKYTDFKVEYGPVDAKDLPAYLENGGKTTPAMRQVRFPILDRLVLAPMELTLGAGKLFYFLLTMLVLLGLTSEGILFERAWDTGYYIVGGALVSFLSGALLFPILLPLLPFRSFALKGFMLGVAATLIFLKLNPEALASIPLLLSLSLIMPVFTSFLALNFTGATTFTNPSGVKKEMKLAVPFYKVAAIAGALSLVAVLIENWRAL